MMDKQQLRHTIRELRSTLERSESVEPDQLAELRRLTDELERAVDEREELRSEDVDPHAGPLRESLLKFESEHPQLAVAIGRVADALAAMGF